MDTTRHTPETHVRTTKRSAPARVPRRLPILGTSLPRASLFPAALLLAAILATALAAPVFAAGGSVTTVSAKSGDRVIAAFPHRVVPAESTRASLAKDLLATAIEEAGSSRARGADLHELDLVVEYANAPDDLDALLAADALAGAAADVSGGVAATTVGGVTVQGTLATVGDLTLDLSLLPLADRAWFVDLLARAYPAMVQVYGPPARPLTVRVWKNSALPYAGLYSPTGNLLLVRESSEDTVIHELLHAFRDDIMSTVPMYEEGIVRAAEVEVLDGLGVSSWDSGHSYVFDRMYAAHNQDTLMSASGAILAGYAPMYLLRYQEAGMAWGKAELARPGFLRAFNALYVAAALSDPVMSTDGAAQRALFGTMGGSIEGADPGSWQVLQEALTPTGTEGLQLHADVTDDSLTVRLYDRDAARTERAAPGSLEVSVTPYGSPSTQTMAAYTNGYGMASLALGTPSPTRLDVIVSAQTGYGSATRVLQAYGGVGTGLFGIIPGDAHAATGTITATILPAGGRPSSFSARFIGHAFTLPELNDFRGAVSLALVFDGEPDTYETSVIKGRGATYVRLVALTRAIHAPKRPGRKVDTHRIPPPPVPGSPTTAGPATRLRP